MRSEPVPECAVEKIREAISWAREVQEAERERAQTDENPLTRVVASDVAVLYGVLARVAELYLEHAPARTEDGSSDVTTMETPGRRIPVKAAEAVAKEHGLRQLLLIGWDGRSAHVVTYGRTKKDCALAARAQDFWTGRIREFSFRGEVPNAR